jgi:hypothetical protein
MAWTILVDPSEPEFFNRAYIRGVAIYRSDCTLSWPSPYILRASEPVHNFYVEFTFRTDVYLANSNWYSLYDVFDTVDGYVISPPGPFDFTAYIGTGFPPNSFERHIELAYTPFYTPPQIATLPIYDTSPWITDPYIP